MQISNIKFLKSLYILNLLIALILLSNPSFCADSYNPESKIKVKVNYTENPNPIDFFFNNNEFEKYTEIGPHEKLDGVWIGNYALSQESVFWVNHSVEKSHIYNSVYFGPYTINIKFNLTDKEILSSLEIIQKDVKYSSINIDLANDKQINYWTKAKSRDWFQVVRGKIFRVNENQLFTVFQTIVYESKIPIYAFKGEAVLNRL